jgi:hypothetical protein
MPLRHVGSGGLAPGILTLARGESEWSVSRPAKIHLLYSRDWSLVDFQSRSENSGEQKYFLMLSETEVGFLGLPGKI